MGQTSNRNEKIMKESAIQQACYMWFNNTFCLKHHEPRLLMFSVPNEGTSAKEQMYKKAVGMLPGVSDTIIIVPGKVVFCEFKDDKGRQGPKQIEFEERVKKLGYDYWIIRSLEDFKLKIESL
jgi:hypothetical protein